MKNRKYPLGIQTFENIIKGQYVYVDKTALAYELANENKYCFLSRPRRFGKSLLVTTLQAYFEGRKELFGGLAMEKLETEWNEHPVIHLDISKGKFYDLTSLHATLNNHYDGYHFSGNGEDIYNPYSLFCTLDSNDFGDYWFSTGTPTLLIELLQEKHLDMLDLDDIIATADRFDTPTENITDPVPVLYQSGYLTIKGYNRRSKIFKLGFPNSEVKQGFSNSLFRYYAPDNMGDKDAEE